MSVSRYVLWNVSSITHANERPQKLARHNADSLRSHIVVSVRGILITAIHDKVLRVSIDNADCNPAGVSFSAELVETVEYLSKMDDLLVSCFAAVVGLPLLYLFLGSACLALLAPWPCG